MMERPVMKLIIVRWAPLLPVINGLIVPSQVLALSRVSVKKVMLVTASRVVKKLICVLLVLVIRMLIVVVLDLLSSLVLVVTASRVMV
jgi:hypothetical protein